MPFSFAFGSVLFVALCAKFAFLVAGYLEVIGYVGTHWYTTKP